MSNPSSEFPDLASKVPEDVASSAARRPRVTFCSMPFDMIDQADAIDLLAARSPDSPFAYVTTPNVDHVVRLQQDDSDLLTLYRNAWMTVCDSRVLAALSTVAGVHLPVSTGAGMTDALLREVIAPSDRINVIGTDAHVVARVRDRYKLAFVDHLIPPMRLREQPEEIARCIRFIEQHPARFTFLAVGSPQQELIAHGAWARGKARGLGLCIGTALLFSSEVVPRAPRWMQTMALEWLHRLWQEPRRLGHRYLVDDMRIFAMLWRDLVTQRARWASAARAQRRASG